MIRCNLVPRRATRTFVLLVAFPLFEAAGKERHLMEPKLCDMNGTCTSRAFSITPTGKENELSEFVFDVTIRINSLREDYESSGLKEVFEKALCDYHDWNIDMFCGRDENINFNNCTITDVLASDASEEQRYNSEGTSGLVFDQRSYTIEYSTRGKCGTFCPYNALPGQNSLDYRMLRRRLNPMCGRFLIHFLNEANITDSVNLEVLKDKLVVDKCDSIFACEYAECDCLNSGKEPDASSSAVNSMCFQLLLSLLFILFLIT